MRATGRFAALAAGLALGTTPLAAAAQSLPPPPYQSADQGAQTYNQAPQSMDRYGGGASRRAYAPARQPGAQGAAQPAAGPYLAWAGKTQVEAAPTAPAQSGSWSNMAERWDAAPERPVQSQAPIPYQPRMQAAQTAPPSDGWRPYRPQNAAPPPAPTSIYDAPPQSQAAAPPPPPYRQANAAPNAQTGPHLYSLHREYGLQPDPIPLPPQFFGPTADLSASVAEPLSKRTTTVNGQTKTVNVPDDQGAQ
jgi:hypothetical protein